jgi:tetratricopeptide (TPR) repeat protein
MLGVVVFGVNRDNLDELYKKGKWRELYLVVKKLLRVSPRSYRLNLYMARYYYNVGKYKDAIKFYERAIIYSDEKIALPYSELANLYYHMRDYESSLRVSDKCLKREEGEYSCLLTLARTYYKLEKFKDAYDVIRKIVLLGNNRYETYLYLGLVYLNRGKYEKAITAFKYGLLLKPADGVLYYNLGVCYERLGNYEMALIMYDKGMREYGNNDVMREAKILVQEHIFSLPR